MCYNMPIISHVSLCIRHGVIVHMHNIKHAQIAGITCAFTFLFYILTCVMCVLFIIIMLSHSLLN